MKKINILMLTVLIFSFCFVLTDKSSAVTRSKIMSTAENYKNYEWMPTENNICHKVTAEAGTAEAIKKNCKKCSEWNKWGGCISWQWVDCRIDTPDRNTYTAWSESVGWKYEKDENGNWKSVKGIPYDWGGFSSLVSFKAGIEGDKDGGNKKCAGDIYCYGHGESGTVGVDCSGFVSRIWDLKSKKSTSTLPKISKKLEEYDNLKKGDILNVKYNHVMLFREFDQDPKKLWVYESSANDWKVNDRKYDIKEELKRDRYIPYIYPYIEDSNFSLADIEIVINRSESMEGRKMEMVKEMTKEFVDRMISNIRVGITSFNNQSFINHPLTLIGKGETVKELKKEAIDNIYCSGNQVKVEKGLATARGKINDIEKRGLFRMIFLISDGSEDRDSLEEAVSEIREDGIMFFNIKMDYDDDDDDDPIPPDDDVVMASIVSSQNSNSGDQETEMFLRNMVEATGGGHYTVETPNDFREFFQDILSEIYQEKGIKLLEEEFISEGEINEEATVWIDPDVEKTTFSINWENIESDLDLVLIQPDGIEIDSTTAGSNSDISFVSGGAYEIYKVDYPMNGLWKLEIHGKEIFLEEEIYSISVSGLLGMDFQVEFDQEEYYLDDPIKITAGIVDQILDIPEDQYIYGAKVELEIKYPEGNISIFDIFDNNTNGDEEAGDGIYTGTFSDTFLIGNYTFTVRVQGESNNESSSFERVKIVTAFVSEFKNESARELKREALEKLKAFPKTNNRRCRKNIDRAVRFIEKSLDEKFWIDDSHLNSVLNFSKKKSKKSGVWVFNYDRSAIKGLLKIVRDKNKCSSVLNKDEVRNIIDKLVQADELLAEVILDKARNSSAKNSRIQKIIDRQIKRAEKSMEKAYRELEKNKPDRAIYYFRNAWIHSQIAVRMGN